LTTTTVALIEGKATQYDVYVIKVMTEL